MDNTNFKNVIRMEDSKEEREKVFLIQSSNKEVPNPYNGKKRILIFAILLKIVLVIKLSYT